MPILEAANCSHAEVEHVGVAILETQPGKFHCGFLLRLEDEPPQILHLAFHHRLRLSDAELPYRWADVGLDIVNKRVLAGQLYQLKDGSPNVPYAFDAEGIAFDPETGALSPPPVGKGLTCATFLVAALLSFGYPALVDETTWPHRDEDAQWQADIVQTLAQFASPNHVELVMQQVGATRIRPDEVVGAATLSELNWPVAFLDARALADQVIEDLQQAA